jgi:hypothetical protein
VSDIIEKLLDESLIFNLCKMGWNEVEKRLESSAFGEIDLLGNSGYLLWSI